MKQNRIKIACFLALIVLFNIIGANTQVLAKTSSLEIVIPNYEDLTDFLKTEKIILSAWEISKEYGGNISTINKNEIVKNLNDIPETQLNKKYTPHKIKAEFVNDRLVVEEVEQGIYFFNNQFTTKDNIYKSQFVVEINDKTSEKIELVDKIKVEPKEFGRLRLIKVDQDGKRLGRVGFRFYQKINDKLDKVPLIGEYEYNLKGDKEKILYTDKNGEVFIDKLPYGTYVFKEEKPLEGYRILEDKKEITISTNQEVNVKIVNEKIQFGGHKFLKIANDKKQTPLKGAIFKVVRYVGEKSEAVIQNGSQLYIESDDKGAFAVDNLAYGKYALWEVKAPKGYRKLINPIDFTIDANSSTKVIIIKNDKEPEIPVPKTGDLMLPILMLASCTLFGTGYKLSKDEKK